MRLRLTTAKAAGVPFDRAWALAWERIRWGHNSLARRMEKRAIAAVRPAWQRAYEDTDADRRDGSAVVLLDTHSATHNVRTIKV